MPCGGRSPAYGELIRNTPLLLQLFFWSATLHALHSPRQELVPLPGVLLTNRGLSSTAIHFASGFAGALALATPLAALLAGLALRRRGWSPRVATGIGLAILLLGIAGLALHGDIRADLPTLRGFNISGGLSLTPEFSALLIGLFVNASALIAEIVRSGIQSVPKGQWEAGRAVGLGNGQIMRLIVLPQALRVITPLMTLSYLSLTKNSSLAVAIGYPDLVNIINTTANPTGQALEVIMIMVAIYLLICAAVSLAMNRYNARQVLKGLQR
ncbi:ABC transporter permease subunit [Mesorhizobium sp. BR1-1-16]|uniref:ABC transporter permease subunit n=1 Tax=Mesorhizobium sp. BR1-1-16 TaxID=2876653 RepID=UPI001CCFB47C|nr:ABC transporter permease subunit [Mesorhizobium sp. BR1-1-16]MBZ9937529.1 ABC transporter permease subunit [Mesorhizobium sp. BR1-1-16]